MSSQQHQRADQAQFHAVKSVLAHYGLGASEKVAARWEKMMSAGKLTDHDLGRLLDHTGGGDNEGIRKALQSFVSPLTPAQLARHEAFHAKVLPHYMQARGVLKPSAQAVLDSGPAFSMNGTGQVHIDPAAWHQVRGAEFGPLPQSALRSTVEHELAESRMQRGATAERYIPRPFSSHGGPGALIAERLGFQNPDVHAYRDLMRTEATNEADMLKRLRQHGMVGNYVMPLGGRAHRSVDAPQNMRKQQIDLEARRNAEVRSRMSGAREDLLTRYQTHATPEERAQGAPPMLPTPRSDTDLASPEMTMFIDGQLKKLKQNMLANKTRRRFVTPVPDFIATQSGG